MGNNRSSIVFHREWHDAAVCLCDEQRLEFYDSIMDYAFGEGELIPAFQEVNFSMKLMCSQIDADNSILERVGILEEVVQKLQKELEEYSTQKEERKNIDVNIDNNINKAGINIEEVKNEENQKKSPVKSKRFVKPTVEKIKQYVEEQQYDIDAETFFNYYESKGWVIGKSPMKDWKAAIRTWARNRKKNNSSVSDLFKQSINSGEEDLVINGQKYR